MSYPVPRKVTITLADTLTLTALEWARVAVIVGVPHDRLGALLKAVTQRSGTPEDLELGARAIYALALQLERRLDRALTWEDAETWDVTIREAPEEAAIAEAEADAEVAAAMLTGAPVATRAADVTVAQMAAYGRAHERARTAAARGR